MRITLLTSTGMYPYDIGGPAVFLQSLYGALAPRFDVQVVLLTQRRYHQEGIVSVLRSPLECLSRIVNSEFLILNSPSQTFLPLMFLRRMLNRKNMVILHGGLFIEQKGLRANISKRLVVSTLKRARCLVVSPSYCLHDLLFKGFGVKSFVIHNGIDLEYVEEVISHRFRSRRNVIFVGFLRKIKGIFLLLEALEKLLNRGFSCNLYIIGSGDLENALRLHMKQRGLSQFTHFIGILNHRKVLEMIKGADVLVLPSYWENLPTVIIEAMACGKPVVATRVGGIPEIIRDGFNGMLIPKGSSDALAESISFMLQNPRTAKRLGDAARRTVRRKFSLAVMRKKYIELIEVESAKTPASR